jgi:ATP-dependent DNA helicase RecQ
MLMPDTPFEKLDIDFVELERRKQAESAKLERVISYATTRRCRQLDILGYFGDPDRKACGSCDRCVPQGQNSSIDRAATKQLEIGAGTLEAVRMALSGAARTQGRIGKLLLARMLGGSAAPQVKRLQLDRLSTFGLLRDLKQSEVVELLDAMLQRGLLMQQELDIKPKKERKHRMPVISITSFGTDVMLGHCSLDGLHVLPELTTKLNAKLRAPAKSAKSKQTRRLP